MTLMTPEEYKYLVEEQKREIGNLKRMRDSTRDKVIDEVLEILKKRVLLPPRQSVNIFKEVQGLRTASNGDAKQ